MGEKDIKVMEEGRVGNEDQGQEQDRVKVTGSGVIAVLDNAQDMDPCSCDLVKVKNRSLCVHVLILAARLPTGIPAEST